MAPSAKDVNANTEVRPEDEVTRDMVTVKFDVEARRAFLRSKKTGDSRMIPVAHRLEYWILDQLRRLGFGG